MRRKEPEKAEKLLACAFKLFSERGIAKVNIDAIAAEAGVTKGSVYHHFKSKKEIILGACAHYYSTWQKNTYREILKGQTALEKLEMAIRFSVRSCLLDSKNRIFTLEILTLSLHEDAVRQSWAQFYDSARQFYVNLVNEAVSNDELAHSEDIEAKVNFMLCTMEGIKQQAHFDKKICTKKSEENICSHLMNIISK